LLRHSIVPPSVCVTRLYSTCRPNPEPPTPRLVVKNGSKIFGRCSGAIP
jgi:hypothetical protein